MTRREHLIKTASRMFRARGYRATGIDAILEESGVAKATLYRYFRSKDELVLAVLHAEDEAFLARLNAAFDDERGDVLALFDLAAEWFESPDFNGCTFANAAAEFPDPVHGVREAAVAHKEAVRALILARLNERRVEHAELLTTQLHLLYEGAVTMAQIEPRHDWATAARAAASGLLAANSAPQLRLF